MGVGLGRRLGQVRGLQQGAEDTCLGLPECKTTFLRPGQQSKGELAWYPIQARTPRPRHSTAPPRGTCSCCWRVGGADLYNLDITKQHRCDSCVSYTHEMKIVIRSSALCVLLPNQAHWLMSVTHMARNRRCNGLCARGASKIDRVFGIGPKI
jgi:hypothetical protein